MQDEEKEEDDQGAQDSICDPKKDDRERACLPLRPALLSHAMSSEVGCQEKTARLAAAQQPCRQRQTEGELEGTSLQM